MLKKENSVTGGYSMENKKVTAGRDRLGEFAPQFAELNDDVLFGQVWSRESQLSPRERSMITVAALMGAGVTDFAMKSHLQKAKENGITKEEMVEMITQLAFYAGWPRAWAVFPLAQEVYDDVK
jgi:4-carboxymuconolactone decarboxylase